MHVLLALAVVIVGHHGSADDHGDHAGAEFAPARVAPIAFTRPQWWL
jgi:hypothetical protein